MKKILFLMLVLGAIISTNSYAQAGDPPSQLQQLKDKFKAPMIEKTGLTEAQVDKIIEINFEMRESMKAYANLSEEERAVKVKELKAARDKKLTEIPLTPEQIESVWAFYKSQAKDAPKKPAN